MASWFLWAVSAQYLIAAGAYAWNRNWPAAGCFLAYSVANVCIIYMAK